MQDGDYFSRLSRTSTQGVLPYVLLHLARERAMPNRWRSYSIQVNLRRAISSMDLACLGCSEIFGIEGAMISHRIREIPPPPLPPLSPRRRGQVSLHDAPGTSKKVCEEWRRSRRLASALVLSPRPPSCRFLHISLVSDTVGVSELEDSNARCCHFNVLHEIPFRVPVPRPW